MLAEFPVLRQQARLKSFGSYTGFSSYDSEGEVMATATQSALIQELDTKKRSSASRHFEDALRQKIVGQDEAVQALGELYQVFCAGLHPPGRPVGNLLFLGPTGSGKTRIVEAAAEILFGDSRALIKVDCAEFQHSHEIAKLIGSPPGYLGHRETHPLITQEELAKSHRGELKLSFLLFDEIEKASDALWQLLLGILDKATLTLGDNRRVDLSQTVIFLTSNLGGGEITELMQGGMGFIQPKDMPVKGLNEKVERTAVEAARRKFSPEFMNRLDKVVVFHPLKREELDEVLEIELAASAEALIGLCDESLPVSDNERSKAVPAARGHRPEIWSTPPEARHRALCSLPDGEAARHRASALGGCPSDRSASRRRRVGLYKGRGTVLFLCTDALHHVEFKTPYDCGGSGMSACDGRGTRGINYDRPNPGLLWQMEG